MVPQFLATVLVIGPLTTVLVAALLYVLAMIAMDVAAGVNAMAVTRRRRLANTGRPGRS
jgi:hypothetical protein